jgi:hypothetical protein
VYKFRRGVLFLSVLAYQLLILWNGMNSLSEIALKWFSILPFKGLFALLNNITIYLCNLYKKAVAITTNAYGRPKRIKCFSFDTAIMFYIINIFVGSK